MQHALHVTITLGIPSTTSSKHVANIYATVGRVHAAKARNVPFLTTVCKREARTLHMTCCTLLNLPEHVFDSKSGPKRPDCTVQHSW